MKKSILLYIFLVGTFSLLTWWVIDLGKEMVPKTELMNSQEPHAYGKTKALVISSEQSIAEQFLSNIQSPLGLLLLQILVVLIVSKFFGFLFSKIGQPRVIGEMIAGIFLGPSVLGWVLPPSSDFLFPKTSMGNLQFMSQIGLVLFMFIIGMELDLEKLKNKAFNALVISHVSIVLPYFLGVTLSYFLYERFATPDVTFMAFALFMGIAMSITAFPVLARILQERRLTKTPLGAMVLTCAATDDVTAWCILAAVVAIVKAGSLMSALFTISLALLFVLVMLYFVRKWLKRLSEKYHHHKTLSKRMIVIVFVVMLSSAYISEIIGIHALFGAFLAGVIMPHKTQFKEMMTDKIEDISVLLLLPIFFAFTGLRTQIGLLNDGNLWAVCAGIIFVAIAGKLGGSSISARLVGYSWKDSFAIGTLMNTRGLMELIVLNIGYELGIISASIFTMMVLMALFTTFMTGPILNLIDYWNKPLAK